VRGSTEITEAAGVVTLSRAELPRTSLRLKQQVSAWQGGEMHGGSNDALITWTVEHSYLVGLLGIPP
jgi:hypothetical protein